MSDQADQQWSFVYDVAEASIEHDRMIFMPLSSWSEHRGRTGWFTVEPSNPEYKFWFWLVVNAELFPRLTNENMAAAREAFHSLTAEELEKVTLPNGC